MLTKSLEVFYVFIKRGIYYRIIKRLLLIEFALMLVITLYQENYSAV